MGSRAFKSSTVKESKNTKSGHFSGTQIAEYYGMNGKMLHSLTLIFCLAGFVSCSKNASSEGNGQLIASHWGELSDLEEILPGRAYLIDYKLHDTYRVCYQAALSARWPQFKEELTTALAHWGRYIGVSITLEVKERVFQTPPKDSDANQALEFYQKNYCQDADLIVAEFDLNGPLAQVQQSYSYVMKNGKREIKSLTKGLLIQSENEDFNWITLSEAFGADAIDKIHETLLERKTYYIKKSAEEHFLLSTLIHEAGHIWGLCDQYQLADGNTNCHPEYSTAELIDESIMAREPLFIPLFLQDDDIDGIQNLANRRRVNWNAIATTPMAFAPQYKIIATYKSSSKIILKAVVGKKETISGTIELKIFDENGDLGNLTAEVKTAIHEEEHFETIELDLDSRWQILSAVFVDSEGTEHSIKLD